jgi:hypothetical protein
MNIWQGSLIPTNGVHIIETEYPRGFNVARYDADGLTSSGRWFETLEKARAYAKAISNAAPRQRLPRMIPVSQRCTVA